MARISNLASVELLRRTESLTSDVKVVQLNHVQSYDAFEVALRIAGADGKVVQEEKLLLEGLRGSEQTMENKSDASHKIDKQFDRLDFAISESKSELRKLKPGSQDTSTLVFRNNSNHCSLEINIATETVNSNLIKEAKEKVKAFKRARKALRQLVAKYSDQELLAQIKYIKKYINIVLAGNTNCAERQFDILVNNLKEAKVVQSSESEQVSRAEALRIAYDVANADDKISKAEIAEINEIFNI